MNRRRYFVKNLAELKAFHGGFHPSSFDLRNVQNVIDDRKQVLSGRMDLVHIRQILRVDVVFHILDQHLAVTQDGSEGCSEFMARVRQKQ